MEIQKINSYLNSGFFLNDTVNQIEKDFLMVDVSFEIEKPVILGPGDFFGEMGLIGDNARNATITTLDEVKLLELTKGDLEELFNEHAVLFEEIENKIASIQSSQ